MAQRLALRLVSLFSPAALAAEVKLCIAKEFFRSLLADKSRTGGYRCEFVSQVEREEPEVQP